MAEAILDVAISPCPNDTFAFYALSRDTRFRLHYLDIEELNQALLAGRFPVSKGSFALMEKIKDRYEILPGGAAIGRGVGPVLVGKIFDGARLALPGENTTAHRLFRFWQRRQATPVAVTIQQMPFFEILPALRRGELDAAVLIHEGRFVYEREGLALVEDLGAWYERETGAMIPLGCIYARRDLVPSQREMFIQALRSSIEASRLEYEQRSATYTGLVLPHMQRLAQETEVPVVEAHVDTYVTADTVQMSAEALNSVDAFRQNCLA